MSWTDALTDSTELIGSFDSGWILAKENGRYFYINEKGRKYGNVNYWGNYEVSTFKDAKPFSYGFNRVSIDEESYIVTVADSVDLNKTDFPETDSPKNYGFALVKSHSSVSGEWQIFEVNDYGYGEIFGLLKSCFKKTDYTHNGVTPFSQEIFYRTPVHIYVDGDRRDDSGTYFYYGAMDSLGNVLGNYLYKFIRRGDTSEPLFENGLELVTKVPPDHRFYEGYYNYKNVIGLMDNTGTIVTDSLYFKIGPFHSDMAVVGYKEKGYGGKMLYGYIDRSGKTVIAPQYYEANPFDGDLALVDRYQKDIADSLIFSKALINKKGEVFAANIGTLTKYDSVWHNSGAYGFEAYIDARTGKQTSKFYARLYPPSEYGLPVPALLWNGSANLRWVGNPRKKRSKKHAIQKVEQWGYVAPNGEEILPIEYDGMTLFDPEYRVAWIWLGKKMALIDTKGQKVIPGWYDYIDDISPDGTVLVKRDGKYAVINIATGEATNGWSRKKPIALSEQKDE
jgi:hypothetical protein